MQMSLVLREPESLTRFCHLSPLYLGLLTLPLLYVQSEDAKMSHWVNYNTRPWFGGLSDSLGMVFIPAQWDNKETRSEN